MRSRPRLVLGGVAAALVLLVSACTGGTFVGNDGSRGSLNCPGAPTAVPTAATSGTCTWSYSPPTSATTTVPPTSTTTVPPTTTTTPVTTTTTTSTTPPPSGGFPTPDTTGAPAGQTFQPVHNGDMTVSSAGTYSGLHVTGALHVTAPGVTITNSWIEGIGVDTDEVIVNGTAAGSTRLTITNTTIGNPSVCNGQPGLGEHDYSADHVRIVGMGDGIRVSGNNVTVTNSFVQTCNHASNHDDGMQVFCDSTSLPQPCHDVRIDHNTLSVANTTNFTAPLFGGATGGINGQLANSAFTNNLLWGGVYSIFLYGKGLAIAGNRIAMNPWYDAADKKTYSGWVFGWADVTCGTVTWTDNRAVAINTNTWQPTADNGALNCA